MDSVKALYLQMRLCMALVQTAVPFFMNLCRHHRHALEKALLPGSSCTPKVVRTHHPTTSSSVVLIGLQHELLKAKTRCMSSLCRLPPFKGKLKDKRFQGALGVPILRRPLELKNGCHRRCLQSSAKPWKPRNSIQLSAYKRLSRRSSQLRGPRCKQGW